MVEIYEEHEQSEIVKGWLRENGGAILLGLVLAFGSLFGFKQWQLWEQTKNQQASAEFDIMVSLLDEDNLDGAVANYEKLKDEYPKSTYTPLASLHMARARLDAGQVDIAVQMLEHAMDNARPESVRIVARERLARVQLDQGNTAEALALINGASSEAGFEAQFAEIRGDVHRARGEFAEAARYYNEALDALEEGTGNRNFLEIKLEAVGQPEEAPEDAS